MSDRAAANGRSARIAGSTGAETLAVGCPFCATMMHDANNQKGTPMKVKDVAEIVAEAL